MSTQDPNKSNSPLSLQRLTAAFAQMLGGTDEGPQEQPQRDECEISPQSIVEAILFVGLNHGAPRTAEELAAQMRDVSPGEVQHAIEQLNAQYLADGAAYHIVGSAAGYQMQLREELQRVREKFNGRIKESRLSPKALEVLSVVAYRQPVSGADVDRLRGVSSRTLLSQLVRRGLLHRSSHTTADPHYETTERFLKFFRIESVSQLPRAAELDD